jgi:hypothetical protein
MSFENIADVKIKNILTTWYTTDKFGARGIHLFDNVHLIGIDKHGNRIRDRSQRVFIPLNEINWTSTPAPTALLNANNYDFAIVNIIREVTTKTKQRRPVQPPPTAPYAELEELDSDSYLLPKQSGINTTVV